MNAEFQWWLLLVGLVIGALLVFLVMADFSRSADEQADAELGHEADWIAGLLRSGPDQAEGPIDPATIEEILRLNREWLAGPGLPAQGPLPTQGPLPDPLPAGAPSVAAGPAAAVDGEDVGGDLDRDPADVEGDGAQG